MQQTYITNNFKETQNLGEQFAQTLRGGEVLALHGDLGSGKTTFVQGLAKGLGVKSKIISPTFIIVRQYKLTDPLRQFYHIDLYRIDKKQSIRELGLSELTTDPQNITVIEWAERMSKLLPDKRIDLHFEYIGDDKRRIIVNNIKEA